MLSRDELFTAFVVGGRFTRPKPVNAGRFYTMGKKVLFFAGHQSSMPLPELLGRRLAEVTGSMKGLWQLVVVFHRVEVVMLHTRTIEAALDAIHSGLQIYTQRTGPCLNDQPEQVIFVSLDHPELTEGMPVEQQHDVEVNPTILGAGLTGHDVPNRAAVWAALAFEVSVDLAL